MNATQSQALSQPLAQPLDRAWGLVFACAFAGIFSAMSLLVGSLPTLTSFIEADTGWSRGQIIGVLGILVMSGAFLGPIVGKMIDRDGARKYIVFGHITSSAALISVAATNQSIFMFYGIIAVTAILFVAANQIAYSKVLVQWFDQKLGMALGLSAAGAGVGAIFLPPLTAILAEEYGWRMTLALYGAVALIAATPIVLLFVHDRKAGTANLSTGGGKAGEMVEAMGSGEFFKTFKTTWVAQPEFRLVVLLFVVLGIAHAGIVLNMVPMQVDKGMSPVIAAGAQSALGIALIIGRVAGGALLDHFNSPRPLLVGVGAALVGIAMLGFVDGVVPVYIAACLIGFGSGIENDGIPFLTSRYFPQENFAKLSAGILSISAFSLAIGPVTVGILRDVTGSYDLACAIAAIVMVFAMFITWRLPKFQNAQEIK
jgi:MFS family permease